MQDAKSIEMNNNSQGTVLTFGVFDGIHVAHQKVINLVVDTAKKLALKSVVISFDPHPALSVLGEAPPALMTVNKKVELLKKLGVNEVVVEDFNKEFSQFSSDEFVKNILVDKFNAKKVVVGYDCAFGKNRTGNKQILKELGERYGFSVSILDPYRINGEVVSSTRIRSAIMEGDLNLANRFLGRPYSISGPVVSGKGVGRNIGYATANIKPQPQVLPPFGVYAAIVDIDDTKGFLGILNIGMQPTFGKNKFQIEVH
ncbi:bifunctional riboflavin kinase/FAD synthetase, partial [Candidatus Poribacteria bacterium]|nr:bifunctional riboflavin kinase/FAD synthetase [Candidatus Poribacteria bacterium]